MDADDITRIAQALKDLMPAAPPASAPAALSAADSSAIRAVSVKLPDFWSKKPELWFVQVESQFNTKSITADKTKFDYVVQSLDNATAAEVEAIITAPPSDGTSYKTLKEALINAFGKSADSKADELLNMGGLGDRKPTSLLRHMQSLNSDFDTLFRCLFISKLPHEVQVVLSASDEKDVTKLAEMADKIVENSQRRLNSQATPANPLGVSATRFPPPAHEQKKKSGPPAQKAKDKEAKDGKPCYYHANWGPKATKCPKPSCPYHHTIASAQGIADSSTLNPGAENFTASR